MEEGTLSTGFTDVVCQFFPMIQMNIPQEPLPFLGAARWNLLSILYDLQLVQYTTPFKMVYVSIVLDLMVIVVVTRHLYQSLFPMSLIHHPNCTSFCHLSNYSISGVVRMMSHLTSIGSMC